MKAVTDSKLKEKLQKRITTVKTAIEAKKQQEAINAAETAVKKLESDQKRENVDDAKNMVNAVADSAK